MGIYFLLGFSMFVFSVFLFTVISAFSQDLSAPKDICNRDRGVIFIVAGYCGSGKSSLIKSVLSDSFSDELNIEPFVYFTTRTPRDYEVDGIDYHFVSDKEFAKMNEEGALLDVQEYYGLHYGIPVSIQNLFGRGSSHIFAIGMAGALHLKEVLSKNYPDRVKLVYIKTPTQEVADTRLIIRGQDSDGLRKFRSEQNRRDEACFNQNEDKFDIVLENKSYFEKLIRLCDFIRSCCE